MIKDARGYELNIGDVVVFKHPCGGFKHYDMLIGTIINFNKYTTVELSNGTKVLKRNSSLYKLYKSDSLTPLEKFYGIEIRFRLKEFFNISNPSNDLVDEIIEIWYNNDIFNYDKMDELIEEILNKQKHYEQLNTEEFKHEDN